MLPGSGAERVVRETMEKLVGNWPIVVEHDGTMLELATPGPRETLAAGRFTIFITTSGSDGGWPVTFL